MYTKKFTKFPKSKQISQSYYVLKSNKNIKNGEYISYFKLSKRELQLVENGVIDLKNYIKEKGNYLNNKKEGKWIENTSTSISKIGNYINGKKTGIWNTYYNGDRIESYDYDNKKKVGIWLTKRENGKVIERYDYDNNIKLQPIIRIDVSYPSIAKEKNIQGIVKLKYHISKDCSIKNVVVTKSLSPECDQAAIEAINKFGELLKKYGDNCENKDEEKEFEFRMK